MESFCSEMDDPQSILISSEQQRIKLELELKSMMNRANKSDHLRALQLRSQMERIKSQKEKSLKRNQMIKKQMIEFESTLANVTAKTERLRLLKDEYEQYIERLYPAWKEQVLAKAAETKEKEDVRLNMRRDIDIDRELSMRQQLSSQLSQQNATNGCSQKNGRSASHHDSLSEIFNTDSASVDKPYGGNYAGYRGSYSTSVVTQKQTLDNGNESSDYNPPFRSSTPEHYRQTNRRNEPVSTSMQSLHSERSVTFDEEAIRSQLQGATDQSSYNGIPQQSLRRSTPSPSELLRMSRESSLASSRGSLNSLTGHVTDKPPSGKASLRSANQSPQSSQQFVTETLEVEINRNSSIITNEITLPATRSVQNVKKASPSHQLSGREPDLSSSAVEDAEPSGSRKNSTPSDIHVIPSAQDVDEDEDTESDDNIDNILDGPSAPSSTAAKTSTINLTSSPTKSATTSPAAPASSTASVTVADSYNTSQAVKTMAATAVINAAKDDIMQSMSTTGADEEDEVDQGGNLKESAAFQSFLKGTVSRPTAEIDSDSSEDSIEAMEKQYKVLSLNKTNTLPVGHSWKTQTADNVSTEEEESDGENVDASAPMGYTPSFGSSSVLKKDESNNKDGKSADRNSALASGGTAGMDVRTSATMSSTGGGSSGKGSSVGRKAFLRTDSDVESESDLQIESKPKEDTDLEDDFDFYG